MQNTHSPRARPHRPHRHRRRAVSTTACPFYRDVLGLADVPLDDADGARIAGLAAGDSLVELLEAQSPRLADRQVRREARSGHPSRLLRRRRPRRHAGALPRRRPPPHRRDAAHRRRRKTHRVPASVEHVGRAGRAERPVSHRAVHMSDNLFRSVLSKYHRPPGPCTSTKSATRVMDPRLN